MAEDQAKPERDRRPDLFVLRVVATAFLVFSTAGAATSATVERRIATSDDDAEEFANGSTHLNSKSLVLVHDVSDQTVGMRWTSLGIPQGATITAAYIQFGAWDSQSEVTSLTFRAEAADNPAPFASKSGDISTRGLTSAAATWSPVAWVAGEAGADQRTPDVADVIQEIVSRPGWASGNALVVIVTGTGHRTAWAYDGDPSRAPLLHVEYSGPPPPDSPPVARLSVTWLGKPPRAVSADGSASTDTDATPIASYQFDFGDGTSPVTTTAPTATAQHSYAAAGTYTVSLTATDTGNLTSAPTSVSVTVNPLRRLDNPPVAALSVTQLASPPLTVSADGSASTDTDLTPIASYQFDFGDGTSPVTTTAPTATAQHTYAAAGTYTVWLTATDAGNLTSAPASTSVTVNPPPPVDDPPVAALSVTQLASPPLTVSADGSASTDTDLTPIASYWFDFGDGSSPVTTTAPTATAQHTYAAAGTYTVWLTATDAGNLTSAPASASVTVNPPPPVDDPPVAALSVTQLASPPLTVGADGSASTDTDLTPIASYRFDFGDGTSPVTTTAPTATAQHTYDAAGTYTVSLTATDAGNLTSAPASTSVTVNPPPPVDDPPVAALSVTQLASPPLTVGADGSASTDTDLTPIASYRFDFGDGTSPVTTTAPTATAQHTYAAAGTYTVWLTATDAGNLTSAPTSTSVTVDPPPPPDNPPVAALSATQLASPPLTVSADGSGSTDTDLTPIASYRFDFGDGTSPVTTTAPTATAQHTYAAAGTYTVWLTATDTGNLTSAPASASVTVNPVDNPPVAALSVTQLASPPLTVGADGSASTDTDLTPIASYRFDFGDGTSPVTTTAPTATAQHTYAAAGTYTVTLTATDTGNLTSAPKSVSVTVIPPDNPPVAALSVTQLASPPLTVSADGSGSSDTDLTPIASYRFDFGDGTNPVTTIAPTATAQHTYAAAGTYTVTLTATDTGNLTSAPKSVSVTVIPPDNPPVAALSVTQLASPPLTVSADGSGSTDTDLTPIASYRFDFGDGTNPVTTTAPTATAQHTYAAAGTYTVTLTATDTGNLTSAPKSVSVTVIPPDNPPVAALSVTQLASPPLTVSADGSGSTDTDLTPIASYRFDFGDGSSPVTTTAPTATAPHTYAAAGTYTVSLTATDTGNLTSAPASTSVTVNPVDNPPVAALSVTQLASPPLTVSADGSASTDTDLTPIASYRFDFGDGTSPVTTTAPTATAQHTYAAAGTYTVSLTATDTGNLTSAAKTVSVTVNPPPNQAPNGTINSPISGVSITAGQSVNFQGTGSDPDGNLPLAYFWDLGGGASNRFVEDPGPVVFSTPGTYTVRFIVTDGRGLADPTPDTRTITVNGSGTVVVDEVHWTIMGQTAVTFDWRGSANTIRYGLTTSYSTTVTAQTPSPLPFSSPGPFWEARLTGLEENTLYHYSIGNGPDHTFRTPIARGSSNFTVYAEGDIGNATNWPRMGVVQSMIASGHPNFVLALGDLTYANPGGQALVDRHFNDIMVWSQDAADMPIWGNHEWTSPSDDDLRNYKGRFDLPNAQTSPGSPAVSCCGEDWYWFDYGNVRFIGYPEEWSGAWSDWGTRVAPIMNQAQGDPAIRFIVTFGHKPAYSSGLHNGSSSLKTIMDAMGATYSKYVLNLNGHSHDYERSYPQSGVVHITSGTGGTNLEESNPPCLWSGGCPPPAWSAYRAMHHIALQLRFTATSIEGTAFCGPAGDTGSNQNDVVCTQGEVLDSFFIGGVAVGERHARPGAPGVDQDRSAETAPAVARAWVTPSPVREAGVLYFVNTRPAPATVTLFDVRGSIVRQFVFGQILSPGQHQVVLDGRDERGNPIRSGVYLYQVSMPGQVMAGKLLIVR